MLISQCIFTNLLVVGGKARLRKHIYNLSLNDLGGGSLLFSLSKQCRKSPIPLLHDSSKRLHGKSHFQLKSHLLGS